MVVLVLLLLFNSLAGLNALMDYRLTVAGLPVNILDLLTFIGAGLALITRRRQENEQTHRFYTFILGIFFLSACIGIVGATSNGAILRWSVTALRNLLTIPLVAMIAYQIPYSYGRIKVVFYVLLWTSIISAIVAMVFISHTTSEVAMNGTFNDFRYTKLGGDYGCSAAATLLFSLAAGVWAFPRVMTILLMIVCVLGSLALPHRSEWLCSFATCAYALFFLNRRHFVRTFVVATVASLLVGVAAIVSISAISKASGHDYLSYVTQRALSFLPGQDASPHVNKPWETRMSGIERELTLWMQNPLLGRGFGIQEVDQVSHFGASYHHNVWTSSLAESGPAELAAMLCLVFGLIVVGQKVISSGVDRIFVLVGAMGSSMGIWGFLMSSTTLSLNWQCPAIIVASMLGLLLRVRALQLAQLQALEPVGDFAFHRDPVELDAQQWVEHELHY